MNQNDAVAWAKAQVGQKLDFDGWYGAQCMDLILYYCAKFDWRPTGNANTLQNQTPPAGWQKIKNSATFVPQPGDIFIFTLAPYGHTGIVTSANMNSFTSIDQNWINASDNGSAAAAVTHNYNTFWGVLRPPFLVGATRAQIEQSYWDILERKWDEGGVQTYLKSGYNLDQVIAAHRKSPEFADLQKRKAAQQAAANAAAVAAAAETERKRKEAERIAAEQKAIAEKAEADRLTAEQAALEASKKAGYTEADRIRDNETSNLLKKLLDIILSIFKGKN